MLEVYFFHCKPNFGALKAAATKSLGSSPACDDSKVHYCKTRPALTVSIRFD